MNHLLELQQPEPLRIDADLFVPGLVDRAVLALRLPVLLANGDEMLAVLPLYEAEAS